MRADKAKVVDEVWDDARIESFLNKEPMGETPGDHSKLLYAYRSMRPEDFVRFLTRFKTAGGDIDARNEHGETLLDIIADHAKSGPFQAILSGA
ncbi:MAG: hypothetical protein GKR90_04795 [Pseudomonadales bacterium]|nr:hypothetical protein [Pseudomonadales bacterium]